jgi:cbb3-type cytochrome oxidase subunit 3
MNVIVLTVFIGVMLVSFFILFFLYQTAGKRGASSERDALLPLQEEKNTPASAKPTIPKQT